MSGFDLFDAVDDPNSGSASGSNQPSWPGPSGGAGPWSGNQSGEAGLWPGAQSGDGGMWPGGPGGPGGGSNPTPGGWPSPAPGPAPGGWPGPAPGPAPGGWPGPAPGPAPAPGGGTPPARSSNQSLSVPYRLKLQNGVHDGLLISIKGVIKPNADKVTMDLSTKGDIAFHFNIRFNEGGQQVIVRNSCQSKKWGQEERNLASFPFARGKEFEMEYLCTSSEFKVSVNRSSVLTFKHRVTDLRSINTLSIYYDLDLVSVDQRTR